MKKISFLVGVVLSLAGCSETLENEIIETNKTENKISCCTNVSLQDMICVAEACFSKNTTRSTEAYDIQPYVDAENDTLMYIVKQGSEGWTIYSSDKRVPAILAQSKTGDYNKMMEQDAIKAWIDAMAQDIKAVKHSSDKELTIPLAEQKSNIDFWNSYCNPTLFLNHQTKAIPPITPITPIPTGHYELFSSTQEAVIYDQIDHLMVTHWHQWNPYNRYCPYTSTNNSIHSPAGCVAIAAAQMLYYLHFKWGVPATAPSEASVTGNINNYVMTQSNYTSSVWNYMNDNPIMAAPLIANVGKLVGMEYGNLGSGAYVMDLPSLVFLPYSVSCEYRSYNQELLKSSLSDSIPVILGATGSNDVGHCFISDGYQRYRIKTTNIYEWRYDNIPAHTPVPYVDPRVEVTYGSPYISAITMNWGQGDDYDNGWYTLTGEWVVNGVNFQSQRVMVGNFAKLVRN